MRPVTFLLVALFLSMPAWSADTLMNLPPSQGAQSSTVIRQIAPGAAVVLPNGRITIIKNRLENGRLVTEDGIIVSRDGVIIEGPDQGAFVIPAEQDNALARMEEEKRQDNNDGLGLVQPDSHADMAIAPENGADANKPELRQEQEEKTAPGLDEKIIAVPYQAAQRPATAAQGNIGKDTPTAPDERFTLAELLPMTPAPAQEDGARPETAAKVNPPAKTKEDIQKQDQVKARPELHKPGRQAEAKHQQAPEKEKSKHQEKAPAKTESKPKHEEAKKSAPGHELRIPPEAAKTGNLAFLEGCWQGTRPEYYSRRTIKECFCFDANGQNGKRRVIDPLGGRRCIGSASAHLSQSGVLSVRSSGAACDDGERWGQAEMVCRNSGPRTPCSWVFADAQNGRQSCEIPFIRVESCGR